MALPPPDAVARARMGITDTRTAALQRATEQPTATVVSRGGLVRVGAADPSYLQRYQLWQDWIRRYARTHGVVRFAGSIVADACARSPLRIEHRDANGEWDQADDPRFNGLFDTYRNPRQHTDELVRRHAWFYQTAGELCLVIRDGQRGLEWHVFSRGGVTFPSAVNGKYPDRARAVVREVPFGTSREGTAWQVPVEFVTRCWIPDEEWPGLATSPMAASIEDLHRYAALARDSLRRIESSIMMNGMLWTPGEAHIDNSPPVYDEDGNPVANQGSKLERDYYSIAQRNFTMEDTVGSVVPPMFHWDHDWGPPQWVKLGEALDQNALAFRREALEDFARGVNLPASLVVGGAGGNEGNHWSEWLVDERYFKVTIAPIMDRICHLDLTEAFLIPMLRIDGERNPYDFRVGYDPQPVIVRPDQSDIGLRLHLAGLLNDEKTLEAANFDGHDLMTPPELEKLIKVLAAKSAAQPGSGGPGAPGGGVPVPGGPGTAPVGPGNVLKAPPALPAPAQGSVTVINIDGQRYQVERLAAPEPAPLEPRIESARQALTKIRELRSQTGRELRHFNEYTLDEAITRAGGKLINKTQRKPVELRKRVANAVDLGLPLGSHLAAVGVTEAELLSSHFDVNYKRWVASRILAMRNAEIAAVRAAGIDASFPSEEARAAAANEAANYMAQALLGTATRRLSEGPPLAPPRGEVSGNVPMSTVRNAMAIGEGTRDFNDAPQQDAQPELFDTGDQSIEQIVTDALGDLEPDVSYSWAHGFYGAPDRPFEPHEDLDGFSTNDRESDPALTNDVGFPDVDFFQPGDHDGCTCEWVPDIGARFAQEPDASSIGPDGIAPLGRTQTQIDRALEAAGVKG